MNAPIKRRIATAALAVGIGAAGAVGTAVAAPEASAAVPSGNYNFDTRTYGIIPNHAVLTVRGSTAYVHQYGGSTRVRAHQTRNGMWIQQSGYRWTFRKAAHGRYVGKLYYGPVVMGDTKLTPRNH